MVVVLGNGLTLPPLFFEQGGVRSMFSALKQVCARLCPDSWQPAGCGFHRILQYWCGSRQRHSLCKTTVLQTAQRQAFSLLGCSTRC